MSKFKLGGVPSHAYDLFNRLHDAVNAHNGYEWSKALEALLDTGDPIYAKRLLNEGQVYCGIITGIISTVTPTHNAGIVRLDVPCDGIEFAVISDKTTGRIALMNKQGGPLQVGTPVIIKKWKVRTEAIQILEISPV